MRPTHGPSLRTAQVWAGEPSSSYFSSRTVTALHRRHEVRFSMMVRHKPDTFISDQGTGIGRRLLPRRIASQALTPVSWTTGQVAACALLLRLYLRMCMSKC
ncbi:hypothetical protein JB92DRAFT_1229043 [Gautieria morchelliformis]|nr:hypothetical protein JB92DRAFT_1229043 [Gautieria morchelliformis]